MASKWRRSCCAEIFILKQNRQFHPHSVTAHGANPDQKRDTRNLFPYAATQEPLRRLAYSPGKSEPRKFSTHPRAARAHRQRCSFHPLDFSEVVRMQVCLVGIVPATALRPSVFRESLPRWFSCGRDELTRVKGHHSRRQATTVYSWYFMIAVSCIEASTWRALDVKP